MGEPNINDVLAVFQEFGPRRSIPIFIRWQGAFPEVSALKMKQWEDECKNIEKVAIGLAEREERDQIGRSDAIRELARNFPQLNAVSVERTYDQAWLFIGR